MLKVTPLCILLPLHIFLISLLIAFSGSANAGNGDTLLLPKKVQNHSPKKAAVMSAVLPGLGQAYNKKYWKIPVLYVGVAGLGYLVKSNNDSYQNFRKAYVYRVDNDPSTVDEYINQYSDDNLNTLQEYYHRNRDLSIIGCAALYVFNIIDATVDAHLFAFDVSDELTLSIHPASFTTAWNSLSTGIMLKLNYR